MRWLILILTIAMMGGIGCAANCQNVQQQLDVCQQTLKDQDFIIKKQESTLRQKDQQIEDHKEVIQNLETKINELSRILNITQSEQDRSNERMNTITAAVREYLKEQIRNNREFLTDIALEDFIGNPLIKREFSGDEGTFIIDVAHPIPSQGQINGIGGFFSGSGEIVIKLLRLVGNDFVVLYDKSLQVQATEPSKQFIDFDKPILAKKGDIVAYYFPGQVIAFYDDKIGINTYWQMKTDAYQNGDRVEADDIWQKDKTKRRYSLNYYGVFYKEIDEGQQGGE